MVPVCKCIVFEFGVLGVDGMGVLLTSTLRLGIGLPLTFLPGGYGLASFGATLYSSPTWPT